ncbi:hypothetical protein ACE5IS_02385 [Leptospira wolffii]|uniref:Uncharacterized protein n=1 Tax=Leptospira wolffii TaxID=409998 RepID=A0ABV5BK80_9LEPT|nr:hypothetical protein [Leptospira wolffii]TGK62599.1 hypothetical protein EHQ32_07225 [Leptospira wolffii]TGK65574.1 hypothetical protein EHQ27_18785 [Leptospira wolffii]TGK74015.1 hypothetical protein EHQ35_06540 [Leptospira wolffii]TGL28875.1 hypothetical protein EHQ57_13065 [Leptospira wolffii]TGL49408.1 hypothetical protein EHQ61_13240 [Leptospira wolffii]
MPYMAVGSRQILYSDSSAPAMTGEQPREIAAVADNAVVQPQTVVVPPGGLPPYLGQFLDATV